MWPSIMAKSHGPVHVTSRSASPSRMQKPHSSAPPCYRTTCVVECSGVQVRGLGTRLAGDQVSKKRRRVTYVALTVDPSLAFHVALVKPQFSAWCCSLLVS